MFWPLFPRNFAYVDVNTKLTNITPMKNITRIITLRAGAVLPLLAISAFLTTSAMAQTGLILFSGSGTLSSAKGAPTVSGLFTIEPSGAGLTQLCNDKSATTPAWSPGQSYIAYGDTSTLPFKIYVMEAAGTLHGGTQFVAAQGGVAPSWSPSGAEIVYETLPGYQLEVVSVNPAAGTAGTPEPLIVDPAHEYFDPSWSPDGTRIAFERTTSSGASAIFIYTVETGAVVALPVPYAGVMMEPTWSPNSSQIAFLAENQKTGETAVYLINADGTGLEPFPRYPSNELAAGSTAWSPDGTAIAMALDVPISKTTSQSSICEQDLATGVITVLTPSTLKADDPAWLP